MDDCDEGNDIDDGCTHDERRPAGGDAGSDPPGGRRLATSASGGGSGGGSRSGAVESSRGGSDAMRDVTRDGSGGPVQDRGARVFNAVRPDVGPHGGRSRGRGCDGRGVARA
ncbi:MAG: hypothetical protein U0168_22125 [Nannocystaceae bacterium]